MKIHEYQAKRILADLPAAARLLGVDLNVSGTLRACAEINGYVTVVFWGRWFFRF